MGSLKQILEGIAKAICSVRGYNKKLNAQEFNSEVFLIGKDSLATKMIDSTGVGKKIIKKLTVGMVGKLGVNEVKENAINGATSMSEVIFLNGVTSIGNRAFYGCSNITSITLPSSVINIGVAPFGACTKLNSIVVDEGNEYYDSRENCNAIVKTSSNTLIQGSINSNVPNSIIEIAEEAFRLIPISGKIELPDSVTTIGSYAFSQTQIEEINIPDNVTSIQGECFRSATTLKKVKIATDSTITRIGGSAFFDCERLESMYIPKNVSGILGYTFSGCRRLSSVTFHQQTALNSIGINAFGGCYSLSSFTIQETVETISGDAFSGCRFKRGNLVNNTQLTSATNWGATFYDDEHNGILINGTTMAYCRPNVVSAEIPSGITEIADSVCENRTDLTEVSVLDDSSLSRIGKRAFYGCSSLAKMTFSNGGSFDSIDNEAFRNCGNLKVLDMSRLTSSTPPTLGTSVFTLTHSELKIYVPVGWKVKMLGDKDSGVQGMTNWVNISASKIIEGSPND